MTTALASQVPGRILDRSDYAKVRIELGGHGLFKSDVAPQMLEDLREIIGLADLAGSFTLHAKSKVKGSRHTAGLTIGLPHKLGVFVMGQYGDNGSRVQCLLFKPPLMSEFTFREKLMTALRGWEEAAVRKRPSPPPKTMAASSLSLIPSSAQPKPAPAEVQEDPSLDGFSDDKDNIELVMMVLAEKAVNGRISRSEVTAILMKDFGFTTYQGTGPVHGFLQRSGLLIKKEADFYELKSASPQPALTGMAAQIAALEAMAASLEPLSKRREAIAQRSAELSALIQPLADELDALKREGAEIERKLTSDPSLQAALQRLEKVRMALAS